MIEFAPYTGPVCEDGSPDVGSIEWEQWCDEQFWFMASMKKQKYEHSFTFDIFLPLPSITNQRGHWRTHSGLKVRQKEYAYICSGSSLSGLPKPTGEIQVSLKRVFQGGHKLDDDNLPAAFKSIRDGIADAFGINDGSSRWTWVYSQRKPSKKDHPGLTGEARVSWNSPN